MAPKKPASLKVRALQWLAQREHSRLELRGKLLRLLPKQDEVLADGLADEPNPAVASNRAPPRTPAEAASEVDTLLDWLSAHGYLSEQRFVESRVHARQSRFGNLRIQRELQMHGLPLDASARQGLKESEYERALAVWRKKFGGAVGEPGRTSDGAGGSDEGKHHGSHDGLQANGSEADGAARSAARLRQMRFLSGRGFSPDVIRRVLNTRGEEGHDAEQ